MPDPRQQLLTLLAERSFRLGDFKLSSGGHSDYYVDCRTTTLHAEGAYLIGKVFLDAITRQGWQPKAVGGLTLGADPIVTSVSLTSAREARSIYLSTTLPEPIHGFLVRKVQKDHGTGRRIEGFQDKGAKVVIVDDVCTTGNSTIQALIAARDFGFEVIGVICLVEREEANGRPNIEAVAGQTVPFVSIFKAAELRSVYLKREDAQALVAG